MKVLIVANCHARPLSVSCRALCPSVSFDSIEVNRLKDTDRDEVCAKIDAADIVLYYPISENWKIDFVRSSYITANAKVAYALTNVYFAGLHPDITLVGRGGARLQSPLGDYHSRTAIFCYLNGKSVEETVKLIGRGEFAETLGYFDIWQSSLSELERRSGLADISFYDEFVEILYERLPLYVINHPVNHVHFAAANKILNFLNLPSNKLPSDCVPQFHLSNVIYPVFSYISDQFKLPYGVDVFKPPRTDSFLSLTDFVRSSFETYRNSDQGDLKVMDNFAQWDERFTVSI